MIETGVFPVLKASCNGGLVTGFTICRSHSDVATGKLIIRGRVAMAAGAGVLIDESLIVQKHSSLPVGEHIGD